MVLLRKYIRQLIFENIKKDYATNVFSGLTNKPVNIAHDLKLMENHILREQIYNILKLSGQLSIYPTVESLEELSENAKEK